MRRAAVLLLQLAASLVLLAASTTTWAALPTGYPALIDVALVAQAAPLRQQLQIMRDDSGELDASAAMASQAWRMVSDDGLIGGYSRADIWLRGALYNSSSTTITRWLAIGSARLETVDLYQFDAASEQVRELQQSGTAVPLKRRALLSHVPLFAVTLAPGQRIDFAARIASHSALDVAVTLWEPSAFRQAEGEELTAQALLIGVPLLMALYAIGKGLIWRDRGFLRLGLWILLSLTYIFSFQGYLYRYLLTGGGALVLHAPSTLAGLCTAAFGAMSWAFVPLHRLRGWQRAYQLMIAMALLLSVWTALGDYRTAAPVSNILLGGFYLLWIVSMLHAWRRGLPNARLFLLSFSLVWIGMCEKILELNGILNQRLLPDWQLSWLFQLGLLPMMALIVAGRSLELHRRHLQMQQDLLDNQAQEQLRLEHAVAMRTRELRDALVTADDANHAKSDFLARISHDLRTPLTAILGFADMVQASGNENAGHGRIIGRSARHMLAMVNDLIDYARGDTADQVQNAPTYVHALVHTLAQEGAELARRRNNRFNYRIDGDLPPVLLLDAKRLHRMLSNLLDNAAKYTCDGGIELLVQCLPDPQRGDQLVLTFTIADNGCGIAPFNQARVFEPFERTEDARNQPGIGLGLAIVRQWITRMQGSVKLDSALGVGTTITLSLPTEVAAEEGMARHHVVETSQTAALIDGAGWLVWVVEDSPEIAQLLADQLASLGFSVQNLGDGDAAIAYMRHGPGPDLILTDYHMPGADGGQLVRAARQSLPGVPVVLLSATTPSAQEAARFDACMLKPVNFLDLQDTLTRLLKLDKLPSPHELASLDEAAPELPPMVLLRAAHELIDMGAVSDLIDWIDALEAGYPQYAAFSQHARQLIEQGKLAALAALCRVSDA